MSMDIKFETNCSDEDGWVLISPPYSNNNIKCDDNVEKDKDDVVKVDDDKYEIDVSECSSYTCDCVLKDKDEIVRQRKEWLKKHGLEEDETDYTESMSKYKLGLKLMEKLWGYKPGEGFGPHREVITRPVYPIEHRNSYFGLDNRNSLLGLDNHVEKDKDDVVKDDYHHHSLAKG